MVASKTAILLFSSNVKDYQCLKEMALRLYSNLTVLSSR